MRFTHSSIRALILSAGLWLACGPLSAATPIREPIQPLVPPPGLDMERARLGERLFQDTRLSGNQSQSCASCHQLSRAAQDGRPRPRDSHGRLRRRNTLSLFNVVYNYRLHRDGRFGSLEEQVDRSITSPRGMDADWERVVKRLQADPVMRSWFRRLYPRRGVAPATIQDALAMFQRSLVTPDAPFDRYLRGDRDAVDETVLEGYALFKSYGCIACHQGRNVGGNLYARVGIYEDGHHNHSDPGRAAVTGDPQDQHVFRVASLRNVAVTGPWFHDGSARSLDEAIRLMGRMQLGRDIPPEDRRLIEAFLRSLTGQYRGKPLTQAAARGTMP